MDTILLVPKKKKTANILSSNHTTDSLPVI